MGSIAERASRCGLARHIDVPAKVTAPHSAATVASESDELAARRELRAWRLAAQHLNELGYAAAVSAGLVAPLEREGLAVWAAGRRAA